MTAPDPSDLAALRQLRSVRAPHMPVVGEPRRPDPVRAPEAIDCPVDGCDFKIRMRVMSLSEMERSPLLAEDAEPAQVVQDAILRAAEAEAKRVTGVLDDHGRNAHDPDEFEAACQAVAAGLR